MQYNFENGYEAPLTHSGSATAHIGTSCNTSMDVFPPTGSDQMRENDCLFLLNVDYYGLSMESQPG